jgi:hypothetical protein
MNSANSTISATSAPVKKKIVVKGGKKTSVPVVVVDVGSKAPSITFGEEEIPTPAVVEEGSGELPSKGTLVPEVIPAPAEEIPAQPTKVIPITLVKDDTDRTITVFEYVPKDLINSIIKSGKLSTKDYDEDSWGGMKPPYKNQLTHFKKYLARYAKNSNRISVNYSLYSKIGYGRIYPEKSQSVGSFSRPIRHTLTKGILADIDIKNCQPTILHQVCMSNNITCPFLTNYIENRDTSICPELMALYGCDKYAIKKLFIRLMFGGSFNNWVNEFKIQNNQPTNFITSFTGEMKQIGNIIVANNGELVELISKDKDFKKKAKNNIVGSVLSYFCQEYECKILFCIYKFMLDSNIITLDDFIVLCFDGIMIPIAKYNEDLLIQLKNAVFEKLNFNVDFDKKEMDEDFIDELNSIQEDMNNEDDEVSIPSNEEDEEIDESKIYHMDMEYFDSLRTYKGKKKYFEIFITKILDPPCFIFNRVRGDVKTYENNERPEMYFSIHTETDLVKMFKNFHFTVGEKEKSFINTWLYDPKMKSCFEMDFIPSNTNIRKDGYYYNLFSGYSTYIDTPFTNELTDKTLNQFFRIGRELCGGVQEHFDYLLHYFAHMIKKPAERIPICIIIKGNQGVGKNVWLNAIGNILNKKNYITTANPRDLFGEYAEGFYHKLLVNLNECEGKDSFELEGRIKSFITEDTITINAKYQRPVSIQNFARLIIFTNKATPIPIDVKSGDRRYVVFQTTDEMLKVQHRDQYWSRAVESFKKPEFIARLYDYFNTLDIENYNFVKDRPITDAYREMCKMFVPPEALFFESFIDSCSFEECKFNGDNDEPEVISDVPMRLQSPAYKNEFQIVGSHLYDDFKKWAKSNGFHKKEEHSPSIKQFYGRITELQLPIIKFKNSESRLKFVPADVYNYLISKKWIVNAEHEEVSVEAPAQEPPAFDDPFD